MQIETRDECLAEVRKRMVELPLARKQRFMRDYQLPASDAQTFVWDAALGNYFEEIAKQAKNPKAVANWVINNLRAKMAEAQVSLEQLKFSPVAILELIELVDAGKISNKIAQEVFGELFSTGEVPAKIVEKGGWAQ